MAAPPPPQPGAAAAAAAAAASRSRHFLYDLLWDGCIFGGISGTFGVLVGHPFDTLKLRMQMGGGASLSAAARALLATEGARGLFKGAFSISLGQAPINAMIFGANHFATELLQGAQGGAPLTLPQLFACGTFSGLMQSLVLSPFELLKVQQQMHGVGCRGETLSFREVSSAIVARFGLRGLYRGMSATLLRDGPTFGLYFASYEVSKEALTRALLQRWPAPPHQPPQAQAQTVRRVELMAALPAGALAGAASWAVALPADVVKSNIQGAPLDTPRAQLRLAAVAGRIWRADGAQGFFRGFLPCVLRSLPVNAATFFLLECLRAAKAGGLP